MNKALSLLLCLLLLPMLMVHAELTATVAPGYTWTEGEDISAAALNQTATPSVSVSGTVDGSTGLTTNSVTGDQLATSAVDGTTITFDGSSPRKLKVADGGISTNQVSTDLAGTGLTGGGGAPFSLLLPFTYTNAWRSTYTNLFRPGVANTNVSAITNSASNFWAQVASNVTPGLTVTDTVPLVSGVQGSNTTVTLGALRQFINTNTTPISAVWSGLTNVSGGTNMILFRSSGISNVVRTGVGVYQVNFSNSFANTNYLAFAQPMSSNALVSVVVQNAATNRCTISCGIPGSSQLDQLNVSLLIYP